MNELVIDMLIQASQHEC